MAMEKNETYKILIVDDDKITRLMVNSIFKVKKYSVTQASNGEMALDILADIMPDLIFLDIRMAGIDGFEVLQRIRANDNLKYIKIILLSAETDMNERLKGYEMGADDYIVKPFAGAELVAKAEVFRRMRYIEEKNTSLEDLVQKELDKHKQQEEYMLTQAKLISMGDMVLAIAHYWRQPLAALAIAVQDVQDAFRHDELTEDYIKKNVESSMRHISFMSEIIDNFQKMITEDKSDTFFNVNFAVKDVVGLVREKLQNENVDLFINGILFEEYFNGRLINYYIQGRDWILKQALSSLIHHFLDAIIQKKISASVATDDDLKLRIRLKLWNVGNKVNLSVSTNDETLKSKDLDRVFEPYYNAKESMDSGNEGLGFYFSRTLIEKQLGGKFYAINKDGKTIFIIEAPCVYEEV